MSGFYPEDVKIRVAYKAKPPNQAVQCHHASEIMDATVFLVCNRCGSENTVCLSTKPATSPICVPSAGITMANARFKLIRAHESSTMTTSGNMTLHNSFRISFSPVVPPCTTRQRWVLMGTCACLKFIGEWKFECFVELRTGSVFVVGFFEFISDDT
jgi:hypothetical protein